MQIRRVLSIVLLLPSFVMAQNSKRDVWEPFKYFCRKLGRNRQRATWRVDNAA